ncbi:hypothetical protein AXG93_1474s1150 [Marchantia polymorpha subsp. ruderalis]|uniref:Uncharacterized protein n=1 Tax=Marchantia polymorpha subsp. ruderalis TaxID=1480154 RepID=A0A176WAK6_MARPO|nr:hypothetical protein AXG93_1474s1150 [Marchantia polymorpha subsp. ruderalis]
MASICGTNNPEQHKLELKFDVMFGKNGAFRLLVGSLVHQSLIVKFAVLIFLLLCLKSDPCFQLKFLEELDLEITADRFAIQVLTFQTWSFYADLMSNCFGRAEDLNRRPAGEGNARQREKNVQNMGPAQLHEAEQEVC